MEKWDDPNMFQDEGVAQIVQQLHQACRDAGFFYVVTFSVQSGHMMLPSFGMFGLVKVFRNLLGNELFLFPVHRKN